MTDFDYSATAELYPSRSHFRSRQVQYRRFNSAAEALRYAMEEMPPELFRGALLEIDEERYEGDAIRALYEAADYPLPRAGRAS
ncbi:hypothetical protein EMQ25_07815 [Arsenicitalea aurantiaca]|uniref:Uncharacterized protein n=1 Tax=Arsenicitalea aurantiaca TaxID=1783274 RepID=A0A433XG08_9HYPH|nr:hypothetical protein [Arsenicitalea aurantiaca]RUT33023.1 hypothetical protein EMQ25_07815 [Arsenicitalea aurantiaca]